MKRSPFQYFLSAVVWTALMLGCRGGQMIDGKIVDPVDTIIRKNGVFTDKRGLEIYTGFIGDDCFRAVGCGTPLRKTADKNARRKEALESAIRMARAAIKNRFALDTIAPGGGLSYIDSFREAHTYLCDVIRSGRALVITYDDGDRCCVLFQIHGKKEKTDRPGGRFFKLKNLQREIISGPY